MIKQDFNRNSWNQYSVYLRFTSPIPPLSLFCDCIQYHMHSLKICTDSAAYRALLSQAKNSNYSKLSPLRERLYHTHLLFRMLVSFESLTRANARQVPPFTTNNQPGSASTKSKKKEESDSLIVVWHLTAFQTIALDEHKGNGDFKWGELDKGKIWSGWMGLGIEHYSAFRFKHFISISGTKELVFVRMAGSFWGLCFDLRTGAPFLPGLSLFLQRGTQNFDNLWPNSITTHTLLSYLDRWLARRNLNTEVPVLNAPPTYGRSSTNPNPQTRHKIADFFQRARTRLVCLDCLSTCEEEPRNIHRRYARSWLEGG